MFENRITLFTGHFGSGKTEVAVNYCFQLSQQNENTAIVDMDIVNPFYRTADVKEELNAKNIRTILPVFANTNVDVPSLPPEISSVFEKQEYKVVIDVGGDDLGAKAVSRYREEIINEDYVLYFVINTRRPMTDTKEKIIEMITMIEDSARIKVQGLVNNTNVLEFTQPEDILRGQEIIRAVSETLNIKVAFTSGFYDVLHPIENLIVGEIFYLDKHIKLPWQE